MSGKNNVNPGQYKVAGRERTDDLAKERMKEAKSASARSNPENEAARNKPENKAGKKPPQRAK